MWSNTEKRYNFWFDIDIDNIDITNFDIDIYPRHEKTYMLNYAFFSLLHKWVDTGQTHHFEKLQ